MNDTRISLLHSFAETLVRAVQSGRFVKDVSIQRIDTVIGPRVGIIEIHAGLDAGKLYNALSAGDAAVTRQLVPWDFQGEPNVYMAGKPIRVEVGWSNELAVRDIRVSTISRHPQGNGRWVAGKMDSSATAVLGLNTSTTPHFLIAGQTGSGKTEAIRSAVAQLSRDPDNQIVLVDGKMGRGLAPLSQVRNRVGPLAVEVDDVRRALGWVYAEMMRRYREGVPSSRVVVVLDEIQSYTGKNGDPVITELVKRLVTQGREAKVHCLIGTQHPTMEQFSDNNIRTNLTGRIALRAESATASQVIVGGPYPRADKLLGMGDAYGITPNGVFRMQTAWIPEAELPAYLGGTDKVTVYPEFFTEGIGQVQAEPQTDFSAQETAIALVQAHLGRGRPSLVSALRAAGVSSPGAERGMRLLKQAREVLEYLAEDCWTLQQDDTGCLSVGKDGPQGEIDAKLKE